MLRINEVIVVEGKYDAARLAGIVDTLIITTGGFSVFSDKEKRDLIVRMGKKRGLIVLTDSDDAGCRIRNYINKFAKGVNIKNVYIPSVRGKEPRKPKPSREGLLGVEGMPDKLLENAILAAGAKPKQAKQGDKITYTDLYELGISGTEASAKKRRELQQRIGLPARLSKKALLEVLNSLYTLPELKNAVKEKPALFWDFHGTLATDRVLWFDAADWAIKKYLPGTDIPMSVIEENFSRTCLPWWYFKGGDTRFLLENDGWWRFCEGEFKKMFMRCGIDEKKAEMLAPKIRLYMLRPEIHTLYPDAVQVLAELQKRGYRQYILSNNFPELEDIIKKAGLMPYLSGVICSGKIGFDKPGKQIFEYALNTANTDKAVMIGDSVSDDINGAKNAGLYTVAVHKTAPCPEADAVCNELSEVLQILK